MSEVIWTGLDAQVVLDALNSDDDVGVFLRGHHLVEQAADQACRVLYENYDAFGHDTLSKHLNALAARGAKERHLKRPARSQSIGGISPTRSGSS